MRPRVAQCHFWPGKIYRRANHREQARQQLARAAVMFQEMGAYWLEQVTLET
jgi:hypothetical protein